MKKNYGITRRHFLAATGAAIVAPAIIPSTVLGSHAPSNRITLGVLGLGDRGPAHIQAFMGLPDAQVLAICDPFQPYGKRDQSVIHERSGRRDCTVHQDFREILDRSDIDAIVVASPENWHAVQTVMAVAKGKDVYCEKALTLTVQEGIAMREAVRRYGRVLQVGTQQRSQSQFRRACELARNGYIGALKEVRVGVPGGRALPNVPPKEPPPDLAYDLWLGPAPETPYNDLKCRFNWYFISDYCAGWIQSWGVHHVDIALWGTPKFTIGRVFIEGTAEFPNDGLADTSITWNTRLTTESGLVLSFASNNTPGHGQGCRFIGDRGWVHVNRGGISSEPKSLIDVQLKPNDQRLYESTHHHVNFLECIKTRKDPVSPVEAGHQATTVTLIADIATRLGRRLTWDWSTERFVGDETANRMLSRSMRSPWTV